MRNLKRTLSLVLAMALVVGMMMVGASAASSDFTDSSEITYTEAAEVMTALGVFEGTDQGTFNPTGTLTREQAAAIVCRMLLGDDAENLNTNSTVFTDVAADRWSAGCIGYCAQQGILAGTGNGAFDPEGELTGLAFAKMLLVALGYDPAIEQYVGNDWAVNVAADAVDAGISVSGIIMANAMTREQAAQMAYQTLEANMVRYASKGTTINQPDGSSIIVGNTAAEPVSKTDGDYRDNGTDLYDDDYRQFCERYFSDLKKITGEDDFKRPATQWRLKNDVIGTYSTEADATFTTSVDKDDMYDVIGRTVYNAINNNSSTLEVYVDGEPETTPSVADYFSVSSTSDDAKGTGNGVLTEVYVDDENNVTITQIKTYLAQVDGDYDEDDETLELNMISDANPETTLSSDDFANLAGFADEDYVLVTIAEDEIKTIALADTITGNVTGRTSGTSVTVDGNTYNFSATREEAGTSDDISKTEYAINEEATFILDSYGYIIGVGEASSNNNYVFIRAFENEGTFGATDVVADAFFPDGTRSVIDINRVNGESTITNVTTDSVTVNGNSVAVGWFTYTTTSGGEYRVTEAATRDGGKGITLSGNATTNGNSTVNYGTAADDVIYATNSTVFVVLEDDSVNAYTGIRNVPTTTVVDGSVYVAENSAGYASYVYVDVGDGNVKGATSSATDVIYLLENTPNVSVDSNDKSYYTYDAIVNGEKTTVDANEDFGGNRAIGLYVEVSYDEDGYLADADHVTQSDRDREEYLVDMVNASQVFYSGGVVRADGHAYALADEYSIFVLDPGSNSNSVDATSVTPSRLANRFDSDTPLTGVICAVLDGDGYVTNLFVYSNTDM